MPTTPLKPISAPPAIIMQYLSASWVAMAFFYIVLGFWAIYTLVGIYHWLKYSHGSSFAFPAIAAHLVISFALISYMFSGSAFFLSFLP